MLKLTLESHVNTQLARRRKKTDLLLQLLPQSEIILKEARGKSKETSSLG